jgi:hypothetical protein
VAVAVDVLGPPVLDGDGLLVGFARWEAPGCRLGLLVRRYLRLAGHQPPVRLLVQEKGEFVNFQGEPDDGRPGRGRPGGVYIIVAAIVAIAIVVLLIILIF